SFTNTLMAEAVLDFVSRHPEVWPRVQRRPALAAAITANGNAVTGLAALAATGIHLSAVAWKDDRYSLDLAERFDSLAPRALGSAIVRLETSEIPYSVGGFYEPNWGENIAIQSLVPTLVGAHHHL